MCTKPLLLPVGRAAQNHTRASDFLRRVSYHRVPVLLATEIRDRKRSRWFFVVAVFAALLLSSPAALAQQTPPPSDDNGLDDQYREDIPTGDGDVATGGGGGGGGGGGEGDGAPLPADVQKQLYQQAGGDARALEKLATSPRFGAPPPPVGRPADRLGVSAASDGGNPLSAAVSAVTDGDEAQPIALLLAILAITGSGLAAAAFRRSGRGVQT